MGAAAWLVAGAIGYVLCARATHRQKSARTRASAAAASQALPVSARADIRPKWYPRIEYEKARAFTPKEVEEWNAAQTKRP